MPAVREARILLPDAFVGASCYDDPERARAAAGRAPTTSASGRYSRRPRSPGAVHASLELLARAGEASGLPVAAIGGITAQNAAPRRRGRRRHARGHLGRVRRRGRARTRAQHREPLQDLPRERPMNDRSRSLFERSQRLIPGGVNSPVRAFRAVGGTPVFFRSGRGARLVDEDGREYVDYVGSWGPLILGHADSAVLAAVGEPPRAGLSFGAPTALELEMAELITTSLPSIEQVRLVSSGTEAVMSALRLARGFTGRSIVVKFEGCYHGHSDFLLVKAGSGALTFGNPTSAACPPSSPRTRWCSTTTTRSRLPTRSRATATDRRGGARADRGQHELRAPLAAVHLPRLRELCTRHGAIAGVRRGDDGLPRGPARRAGPVRRDARPHDARAR
jgi:hypothetical protein